MPNPLLDLLRQLFSTEVKTTRGNLNFLLDTGILVTGGAYHSWIKKALQAKYSLALLSKHFKPLLHMWMFLGLFILFTFICALWLSLVKI